jgi:Uma2 family endonuclease
MPPLAQNIEYYTYDDYKEWEGDWELIEGVAYVRHSTAMAPVPMRKHQAVASAMISMLYVQLEGCPECEVLGEIDYKVDEYTTLRPDIVLTCGETNERYLTKAPEIVVEIVSQSTAKRDEIYKFSIYEEEKVNYYILLYPDELRAKVYKLKASKYDKVGDFLQDRYTFKETTCQVILDFEKVFCRFR